MKGQNLSQTKVSEPKSAEAEIWNHGLRILARMIAQMHCHNTQPRSEGNGELDQIILPRPRDRRSRDIDIRPEEEAR